MAILSSVPDELLNTTIKRLNTGKRACRAKSTGPPGESKAALELLRGELMKLRLEIREIQDIYVAIKKQMNKFGNKHKEMFGNSLGK